MRQGSRLMRSASVLNCSAQRTASVRYRCHLRGTMVQTSARLLALLSLLQMRREWTGDELADRLEVGPRTIRRDVDKLRSLGYPVESRPGRRGRLPARRGRRAAAAAARRRRGGRRRGRPADRRVGLGDRDRGGLGPALAKLEQVLPDRLRRRVRALGDVTSAFTFQRPQIDADLLADVAGACRDTCSSASPTSPATSARAQRHDRADRGRLQRLALVPARVRPRARRLAHVPRRPHPRARAASPAAAVGARSPAATPPPTCGRLQRAGDRATRTRRPGRVRVDGPGDADSAARAQPLGHGRARRRGRLRRHHPRPVAPGVPGLDGDARRAVRGARPAGAARCGPAARAADDRHRRRTGGTSG